MKRYELKYEMILICASYKQDKQMCACVYAIMYGTWKQTLQEVVRYRKCDADSFIQIIACTTKRALCSYLQEVFVSISLYNKIMQILQFRQ